MGIENVCKHCHTEFTDECYQTFCPNCREKFHGGTLRMCDRCGNTWEVEAGDCGFTVTSDKGIPIELCEKCEKQELNNG